MSSHKLFERSGSLRAVAHHIEHGECRAIEGGCIGIFFIRFKRIPA